MSVHHLFSSRRRTATPVAVVDDGDDATGTVSPVAVPVAPTPCNVRYFADTGIITVDAYHCTWVCDTQGDGLWWVSAWATPHVRDQVTAATTLCWLNAEAATVIRAMTQGRHLKAVTQ